MIQHQFDWQQNKNSSQGRAEWTTCTHATANAVEGQRAFGASFATETGSLPLFRGANDPRACNTDPVGWRMPVEDEGGAASNNDGSIGSIGNLGNPGGGGGGHVAEGMGPA